MVKPNLLLNCNHCYDLRFRTKINKLPSRIVEIRLYLILNKFIAEIERSQPPPPTHTVFFGGGGTQ